MGTETGTANPLETSRVMTGPVDIRTEKIADRVVTETAVRTGNTAAVATAETVPRAVMDFARTGIIRIGTASNPAIGATLIVPRIGTVTGIGILRLPAGPGVLGLK